MKLRRERLTTFEKSNAEFTAWMKSIDDVVGDMTDTVVIKSLNIQIEKTQVWPFCRSLKFLYNFFYSKLDVQQLLDARDVKEKELDHILDLSHFDIRTTTMSPSRRRLRAHRRKSRGNVIKLCSVLASNLYTKMDIRFLSFSFFMLI